MSLPPPRTTMARLLSAADDGSLLDRRNDAGLVRRSRAPDIRRRPRRRIEHAAAADRTVCDTGLAPVASGVAAAGGKLLLDLPSTSPWLRVLRRWLGLRGVVCAR